MIKNAKEARELVDRHNSSNDLEVLLTIISVEAEMGKTSHSFNETAITKGQIKKLELEGFRIENPPGSFIISW